LRTKKKKIELFFFAKHHEALKCP